MPPPIESLVRPRVLLVDDNEAILTRAAGVLNTSCTIVGTEMEGRAAIDAERWLAENPHIHVKVDFTGQIYAGMAEPPPPEHMGTVGS